MAYQSIDLRCKGCGAPIAVDDVMCSYCYRPIVVSTFNSVYSMPMEKVKKCSGLLQNELKKNPNDAEYNNSLAMCYLKLKLYDKAQSSFEKAIECDFDNSETYFYTAVALLKGKKPFLHTRDVIQKILEYLDAAIMIEEKGIYYYFMAYVKKDYFERKYLISRPKSNELLNIAKQKGYSEYDVKQLNDILNQVTSL